MRWKKLALAQDAQGSGSLFKLASCNNVMISIQLFLLSFHKSPTVGKVYESGIFLHSRLTLFIQMIKSHSCCYGFFMLLIKLGHENFNLKTDYDHCKNDKNSFKEPVSSMAFWVWVWQHGSTPWAIAWRDFVKIRNQQADEQLQQRLGGIRESNNRRSTGSSLHWKTDRHVLLPRLEDYLRKLVFQWLIR